LTNTRDFLEREMLTKIAYRKSLERHQHDDSPMTMSEYSEWYKAQGSIDTLKDILNWDLGQNGFHKHYSGLSINDVLAVILPIISSHNSKCECHSCIANDVLQNFFNTERGIATIKNGEMITKAEDYQT
jgi:hypothetical protein